MFAPGYKGGRKDFFSFDVSEGGPQAPTPTLQHLWGSTPAQTPQPPNAPLGTSVPASSGNKFAGLGGRLSPETTFALGNLGMGMGMNPGGGMAMAQQQPQMPGPLPHWQPQLAGGRIFGGSLFGKFYRGGK